MIFNHRRGSGGDQIAPQRTHVEGAEHYAAHEFFMTVARIDTINQAWLKLRAEGFNIYTVREIVLLRELDQLFPEFDVGTRIGGFENQIAGLRRRTCRCGGATVAIRSRKIANRLASREIGDQLSIFNERNALGFHALVVERVVAEKRQGN